MPALQAMGTTMLDLRGSVRFLARQSGGKLRRMLRPVPYPTGSVLRLHLGCGEIDHPGFVNVDGIDRPHVHHVQRIDLLKRFATGAADLIYCSHALEHFGHRHATRVLREWYRVLSPGGWLCLSVPDFDAMVGMYDHSNHDMGHIIQPLFGAQDYPFNFHYNAFNEASLKALLLKVGFKTVRPWIHGSDPWHSVPDWSGRTIEVAGRAFHISLNMEAQK